jgi:hypothetical protein
MSSCSGHLMIYVFNVNCHSALTRGIQCTTVKFFDFEYLVKMCVLKDHPIFTCGWLQGVSPQQWNNVKRGSHICCWVKITLSYIEHNICSNWNHHCYYISVCHCIPGNIEVFFDLMYYSMLCICWTTHATK